MPKHLNLEINREMRHLGAHLDRFQGSRPPLLALVEHFAKQLLQPPYLQESGRLQQMCDAMGELIAKPSSAGALPEEAA